VDALTPDDVAECILFAVTRPPRVDIEELVIKSIDQSTASRIHRH
jgi:NADP-dependent 3-hydroxy acid dehydrogenase YdfG